MSESKPVVKAVLYTHKTLADGKHPIMIRIIQGKKVKYYSLGYSLPQRLWNKKERLPNREGNKLLPELTIRIKNELLKADKAILNYENEHRGSHIDIEDLYNLLNMKENKGNSSPVYVREIMDKIITDLKSEGRIKTAIVYTDCKRVYTHFIEQENRCKDYRLKDINSDFLKQFETFLKSSFFTNRKGEPGLSKGCISVYLRTFRAVLNKAIKAKLISRENYAFDNFSMGKYSNIDTKKRFINEESLDKIKAYKTTDKDLAFSRDMYLFSYYCFGMNFKDMAFLTNNNIVKGRIEYRRSKTKRTDGSAKEISIKITPEIQSILEKYSNSDNPFLLPILNKVHSVHVSDLNREKVMTSINNRIEKINKIVNKGIKRIAVEEGIVTANESFSFYSARHTFATVLQRKGIDTSVITQTMGHSTELQTATYLGGLTYDRIDQAVSVL